MSSTNTIQTPPKQAQQPRQPRQPRQQPRQQPRRQPPRAEPNRNDHRTQTHAPTVRSLDIPVSKIPFPAKPIELDATGARGALVVKIGGALLESADQHRDAERVRVPAAGCAAGTWLAGIVA